MVVLLLSLSLSMDGCDAVDNVGGGGIDSSGGGGGGGAGGGGGGGE